MYYLAVSCVAHFQFHIHLAFAQVCAQNHEICTGTVCRSLCGAEGCCQKSVYFLSFKFYSYSIQDTLICNTPTDKEQYSLGYTSVKIIRKVTLYFCSSSAE